MAQAMTVEEKKERALAQVRNTQQRATSARKRNVFNGTEGKLTVEHTIEGYHLHIFNDTPGRIQHALDGGYEFVHPEEIGSVKENVTSRNTDVGDKVRFLVNPNAADGEQYGYLMKIKQEWYEEDQLVLQDKNNLIDDAIRGGKGSKDAEGFYVPKGSKIDYKT